MRPAAKILIADSEEAIRILVSKILSPWKAQIIHAGDGNHALILAVQHEPDLFLIDHDLPDMCGADLAGDLRMDDRFAASCIIIMSHDREPPEIEGKEHSWDGWIRTPFAVHRLGDDILEIMMTRCKMQQSRSQKAEE